MCYVISNIFKIFLFFRVFVCNVLLICCKDNVCCFWVEIFLLNDCFLYGSDCNYWCELVSLINNLKRNVFSKDRV